MLVLSRKPNETIRIGDEISVTIVSIENGVVKLGIQAPYRVSVHRGEIYDRIQKENRMASAKLPTQLSQVARQWQQQRERRDTKRNPRERDNES